MHFLNSIKLRHARVGVKSTPFAGGVHTSPEGKRKKKKKKKKKELKHSIMFIDIV